jgi:Co/Zn/Cd efflux system component
VAHLRKPLAAAATLNTAIFLVEGAAGLESNSLSLLMDSVHNLSDEMALILLWLAFVLPVSLSRNLVRSANVFNSAGLIAVSALLFWQAVERFLHPVAVAGWIPMGVGAAAALANWGVARLLRDHTKGNAAIRLAYLHNLGDIQVSLAPVVSGLLVVATGSSVFDPLIAGTIALWLIASTLQEVLASGEELVWPEKVSCGHADEP